MRTFIESVLGVYTPNTIIIDGQVVALNGSAGVDWTYIITGLVFIVVVYSTFRILGTLISR